MIITNTKQLLTQIKTILVEKEIQKKELADRLNISASALTSRLNQKNISVNLLLEICDALGIQMDVKFISKDDSK